MNQVVEDTSDITRDLLIILSTIAPYAKCFLSNYYGGGKNAFNTAVGLKTYPELLLMAQSGDKLPSRITYTR